MNHINHALAITKRYADGGDVEEDRIPESDLPMGPRGVPQITIAPPRAPVEGAIPKAGQQLPASVPTAKEQNLNMAREVMPETTKALTEPAPPPPDVEHVTPDTKLPQTSEGRDYVPAAMEAAAMFIPGPEGGLGGVGTKIATKAAEHLDLAPEVFRQAFKFGEKQGTNPGGWFTGFPDGIQRYIKTPKSEQQAREEVLAGKLYELAGVPAAKTELTRMPNGKLAVASQQLPGVTELGKSGGIADHTLWSIQNHFPADAWLANWDVIGLNKENIMVDSAGNPYRIDHGGALSFRAQGAPKGAKFGNEVGETKTMRDSGINPQAAQYFGGVGLNQSNQTAQRIAGITDQQIEDLVYRYIPNSDEAEKLANKLIARRDDIAKQYGLLGKPSGTAESNAEMAAKLKKEESELSPQQLASKLVSYYGNDADSIANEMFDMAAAGAPSTVDEVYKHLPHHIQENVNASLSYIIETAGHDPWSIHEPESEVVLLPKELPKMMPTPAEEKSTAGPPLKLMQLNKTHSPAQLVQAVAQTHWAEVTKNPKLVTPKQVAKIVSFMNKSPPNALAANMADLSYTQQKNALSWISDHKKLINVKNAIDEIKDQPYTAADLAEYEENQHQHALFEYEMQQGIPKEEQESSFGKKSSPKPKGGKEIDGEFVPQHVFDAINPMDATKYKVKNGKYLTQYDFPNANIEDVKKQGYSTLQLWHGQKKGPEKGGYFYQWHDPLTFKGYNYENEKAIFMSHDPQVGQAYGKGAVLPYVARMDGKIGVVHYPEAHYSQIEKHSKDYAQYSTTTNGRLVKAGRDMGYDMLVVRGMGDVGGAQTQYLILNPAILRAPTAKFNPAKRHLMESLSGIAGIPAAGAATYGITRQGEPQGQARGGRTRGYTMPLKPGSSKAVVSQNIREFHTGPTFAHTAAKFGKERANKQAIAVALNTARKYKGKAGGGPNLGKAEMYKPPKATENFDPEHFERLATRGAMYGLRHEGMINSSVPGRTDKLPMKVKSGSYILPADIPSALGQGNTMAGGEVLKKMFSSGPYGLAPMKSPGRSGMSLAPKMNMRPPSMPKMGGMGGVGKNQFGFAEGGTKGEQEPEESGDHVPIIAAGGEYIIDPVVVRHLGGGDIKAGHRVLDAFVLHTRKKHIETLKKLKPPKK